MTDDNVDDVLDPVDVFNSEDLDLSAAVDAESALSEPQQIEVTVTSDDKPFMTTSFDDYSVSEGLLLCLLLFSFIQTVFRILRRGFSWLL